MTKTVCTKCRSEKVYIVPDEVEKKPQTQTMDDLQQQMTMGIPLVYRQTTYRCADCGYEVSF